MTEKRLGRPIKISRDRILETALEVMLEDGINFSVRKVAGRLNTGPTTIYNHFKNRDGLLAAMSEVSTEHVIPHIDTDLPWDESLKRWANKFRKKFLKAPSLIALSTASDLPATMIEHLLEVSTVIENAGFGRADAVRHAEGLFWLVTGSVLIQDMESNAMKRFQGESENSIPLPKDAVRYATIFGGGNRYEKLWKCQLERNIEGLRALASKS